MKIYKAKRALLFTENMEGKYIMAELKTLVDHVLSSNKGKFFTQEEIRSEVERIKLEEDGKTHILSIVFNQPCLEG